MPKRTGQPNGRIPPWKHVQKQTRRERAEQMQAEYNKLTPEEKLAKLDAGGHRAVKQRARLLKQIESKVE